MNEEERLALVSRLEKSLLSFMEEGYIINAGKYFLTGGAKQFHKLTEQEKIEIFAEGTRWVVYHKDKIVNFTYD